jgi:putative transposase
MFRVIAQQAEDYAVADLCQALGVSRSGYYAWRNRVVKVDELSAPVTQVFWQHGRRYGSRRIVAELQAQDYAIGRRRVRRIMKEQQLQALQPKSFVPRTTDSRHGQRMSPNLLPELEVTRPRQVLVSDITYLPLVSGAWAHLATWLDLYSRKILGWQVASTMTAELVIGALRQAIVRERLPRGLIVQE